MVYLVNECSHELPECELTGDVEGFIHDVKKSHDIFFKIVEERLANHEQFEPLWEDMDVPVSDEFKTQLFRQRYLPWIFHAIGDAFMGEDYEMIQDEYSIDILTSSEIQDGITKVDDKTFDIDGYFTLTLPFDAPEDLTSLGIQFDDFDTTDPEISVHFTLEDVMDKEDEDDESEEEDEDETDDYANEVVELLYQRPVDEHDAIAICAEGKNAIRVATGIQPATMVEYETLLSKVTQFPVDICEVSYTVENGDDEEFTEICLYNTDLTTEDEVQSHLQSDEETGVTSQGFGDFFGYPEYAVTDFQEMLEQGRMVATYFRIEYFYAYIEGEFDRETLEAIELLPFTVRLDNFDKAKEQGLEYRDTLETFIDKYDVEYDLPDYVEADELSTDLEELIVDFSYYLE